MILRSSPKIALGTVTVLGVILPLLVQSFSTNPLLLSTRADVQKCSNNKLSIHNTLTESAKIPLFSTNHEVEDENENETTISSMIKRESSTSRKKKKVQLSNRRSVLHYGMLLSSGSMATLPLAPTATWALSSKSRTDGYAVQHSEREWAYMLSGAQYNILRQGGTERPYSSILEGEERRGIYSCAGCNTPLFESSAKFHSGTGWPSFATALPGVEVEAKNPIQANLAGAELRCKTCGGHLGDVFNDGFLFVNTPAFASGKRYCIDGAALVFQPQDDDDIDAGGGGSTEPVFGDLPPPLPKYRDELPAFLKPPTITPQIQ